MTSLTITDINKRIVASKFTVLRLTAKELAEYPLLFDAHILVAMKFTFKNPTYWGIPITLEEKA